MTADFDGVGADFDGVGTGDADVGGDVGITDEITGDFFTFFFFRVLGIIARQTSNNLFRLEVDNTPRILRLRVWFILSCYTI